MEMAKNTAKLRWVLEEKNKRQQKKWKKKEKKKRIVIENDSLESRRYLFKFGFGSVGGRLAMLHITNPAISLLPSLPPFFNRFFLYHLSSIYIYIYTHFK